jgi:hypothetical protein
VGIGTSTPASLLDVNGATKIRGALDLSTQNITNANQISATTNLVLQPTTGNVGIRTTTPAATLDVNGATKIRGALDLSTNNITNANQISATTNLVLQPTTGNVGIGTSSPSQILQVGNGGRLRISNDITDYSLIGTKETDDASNTRIVVSGFQRSGNPGDIDYVSTSTGAHKFLTGNSGAELMRITSTGRVGIGTSFPRFPLDVVTSVNGQLSVVNPTWMVINGTTLTSGVGQKDISIGATYWVAAANFAAYSDKRIKKNIQSLQTDKCIKIIRELNPVSYNYIDYVSKSTSEMYGFIAQEVINHVSPAILYKSDYIPNLYSHVKFSKYDDNTNKTLWKVTLNKSYTETGVFTFYANKDISGNEYIGSDGYPLSDKEGNQRFKIKIIYYNLTTENEIICYTEKIINDTEFLINAASINNEYNSETMKKYNFEEKEYFLYGQEVDDYHILTYDFVWTVFAASVKEIDRQQQADKARIAELEQEVATQKSIIAQILERLEKIETKSQ